MTDEEAERISFELDASLGQASPFDDAFGYHCDGVGPRTAILPSDWREHAVRYASPATGGVVAFAPQPADICAAKLCAGREKDVEWVSAALREGLVDRSHLQARVRDAARQANLDPGLMEARAAAAAVRA